MDFNVPIPGWLMEGDGKRRRVTGTLGVHEFSPSVRRLSRVNSTLVGARCRPTSLQLPIADESQAATTRCNTTQKIPRYKSCDLPSTGSSWVTKGSTWPSNDRSCACPSSHRDDLGGQHQLLIPTPPESGQAKAPPTFGAVLQAMFTGREMIPIENFVRYPGTSGGSLRLQPHQSPGRLAVPRHGPVQR